MAEIIPLTIHENRPTVFWTAGCGLHKIGLKRTVGEIARVRWLAEAESKMVADYMLDFINSLADEELEVLWLSVDID
jgi:hypothetical protein